MNQCNDYFTFAEKFRAENGERPGPLDAWQAALAQKEAQQEPVAWPRAQEPVVWRIWSPDVTNVYQYTEDGDGEPLYTQPNPALLARHDRLEALLRDAGRFIAWNCFGDCRALSTPDDGAIPTAADVFNAIKKELTL